MNIVNSVNKTAECADTQTGCVVESDKGEAALYKHATIVIANGVVKQIKVVERPEFWYGDNGVRYDKIQGRYIEGSQLSRLILASIK